MVWTGREACDDGDADPRDVCTDGCVEARCGDGILRLDLNAEEPGFEACDDGNLVAGDGCSTQCLAEICGNGRVDTGEACDDGNMIDTDGCAQACQVARCGDGIRQFGQKLAMMATMSLATAVMINAAERAVVTVDLIQARLATMAIRRLETVVPMLVKWLDAVMECREMICDPMKPDLKPVTMGMKVTAIIAFVAVWWLAAAMVTPGWLVKNAMTVTR